MGQEPLKRRGRERWYQPTGPEGTSQSSQIGFAEFKYWLQEMIAPGRTPRRRRKAVGNRPPPGVFWVFVVLGSAVTLAMLGYELVGVQYGAAAYITALTIDFFTVIYGFVVALDIIMQQPMEVSERPTPR